MADKTGEHVYNDEELEDGKHEFDYYLHTNQDDRNEEEPEDSYLDTTEDDGKVNLTNELKDLLKATFDQFDSDKSGNILKREYGYQRVKRIDKSNGI